MKKLLYLLTFSMLFLTACEKKPALTAPASLFVMTDGATAAGLRPGDGPEEFIAAYEPYTIQVAYVDLASNYLVMSIREIPYDSSISTMIANFFVDGEPVSEEELCRKNKVDDAQLYSLLSSHEYLRGHEVIYRYLRFRWEDGRIAEIESQELNYNETFETPRLSTSARGFRSYPAA